MDSKDIQHSPLGKDTDYPATYSPKLLCPIARSDSWRSRGYDETPYSGVDIWNAYEISWLNKKGLPQVVTGEFRVPAASPNLIESKSFKLYLNSFAQTQFDSIQEVSELMKQDLSHCADADIEVSLSRLDSSFSTISSFDGFCLDNLDISIDCYTPDAGLLKNSAGQAKQEKLYSHLLRSRCPVTGQPDWGSVYIEYLGPAIDHEGLLKYIVSHREHSDFHEQCVENMYLDILEHCHAEQLTVYARYLRRGGLDINPLRTNIDIEAKNIRLLRQ